MKRLVLALVFAPALLASPAVALDCEEVLLGAERVEGDVQPVPGGCNFTALVLDTGDGGLWNVPRAAIRGSGIGTKGPPLRDVELRIDNAQPIIDGAPDGPWTTVLLTGEKTDAAFEVDEFIFGTVGLGQVILSGRLLEFPENLAAADPAGVLGIQVEALDLTLEIENFARILDRFGEDSGDAGITPILTDLAESFAALDGQEENAAALSAVAAAMPDPSGRLRLQSGRDPLPVALLALAVANGNAAPLAEAGLQIDWSPAQ
ncbi:MAG: hypothetical protein AAF919_18030 [Pseudomonadota bacterium]